MRVSCTNIALKDLEDRKAKLEGEDAGLSGRRQRVGRGPIPSTADKFATLILEILKEWHFPRTDRVHFELKARDLIIKGKHRTSYGKGLRASPRRRSPSACSSSAGATRP